MHPKELGRHLAGHGVMIVPQAGWATIKNGKLLRLAETQFEVFITVDRNLSYQQDTARIKLGVIVLHAVSNRIRDLLPLVPGILEALLRIQLGEVIVVG